MAVIIQGPWDGKNAFVNKVEYCRRAQREGGAAKRSMLPAAAAGNVADEPSQQDPPAWTRYSTLCTHECFRLGASTVELVLVGSHAVRP